MSSPVSVKSEGIGSALCNLDIGCDEDFLEEYANAEQEDQKEYREASPILDQNVIEQICSSNTKQVLNALMLDLDTVGKKPVTVFSCPSDPSPHRVFKEISLACAPIQPEKVERIGKGLYNVFFVSFADAEYAFGVKTYRNAKMVSLGRAISFFYRVTFEAEEARKDHDDRIVAAVNEGTGKDLVSVTVNEVKRCVTAYVPSLEDWGFILSSPKAVNIKISQGGPFAPAYWMRINRCTAHTNDPDVYKFKVSGIPTGATESALLKGIRDTLTDIVPANYILGLGIYNFKDSGKGSRFGFVFVVGEEASRILEKVEIPVSSNKVPLTFERAVERPSLGKDNRHHSPPQLVAAGPSKAVAPRASSQSAQGDRTPKRKERDWE